MKVVSSKIEGIKNILLIIFQKDKRTQKALNLIFPNMFTKL